MATQSNNNATSAFEQTVFVVDDDEAICDLVRRLVESVGLPVETHATARSFLDAHDPARPGCLVTDVRLPIVSGLELQQELKAGGSPLPVIVITGHADVPMAVRAMRAGAVDLIEKPLNEQRLLESIQGALRQDAQTRRERAWLEEVMQRLATLTARERQVMELLLAAKGNKQIAAQLDIGSRTVEYHRHNVMSKMQAESLADLARMGVAAEIDLKQPA